MNNERMHCPEYGSDKVRYRPNRDNWICDECDQVWEAEHPQECAVKINAAAPSGPARVFLSCAREDDEPFVREEWQFGLECDTVVVTPILSKGANTTFVRRCKEVCHDTKMA